MRRQRLTNGQVLIGVVLFMVLMGIVGTVDCNSRMDVVSDVRRYRAEAQAAAQADECMQPMVALRGGR